MYYVCVCVCVCVCVWFLYLYSYHSKLVSHWSDGMTRRQSPFLSWKISTTHLRKKNPVP